MSGVTDTLRLRRWRAIRNIVEIEHTRDLSPVAGEEVRVTAAINAYVAALASTESEMFNYELWQHGDVLAFTASPSQADAEREILRCYDTYGKDGPVTIYRVTRTIWTPQPIREARET